MVPIGRLYYRYEAKSRVGQAGGRPSGQPRSLVYLREADQHYLLRRIEHVDEANGEALKPGGQVGIVIGKRGFCLVQVEDVVVNEVGREAQSGGDEKIGAYQTAPSGSGLRIDVLSGKGYCRVGQFPVPRCLGTEVIKADPEGGSGPKESTARHIRQLQSDVPIEQAFRRRLFDLSRRAAKVTGSTLAFMRKVSAAQINPEGKELDLWDMQCGANIEQKPRISVTRK